MKKVFLLFMLTPAFASVHYASQTAKPTAKLAYSATKHAAKLASYPVRHSKKTARGAAKAVKASVTAVF